MLYHGKNGTLTIGGGEMEYVRFGRGKRCLVMLPGLGDSLRSMKGMALPLAVAYRLFAKDFTVYIFGRKKDMPEGYTIRDMARDQAEAMAHLGIEKADVFGVSMGGMVAQCLAVAYPQRVNKLVLAVTAARPNAVMREAVAQWWAFAQAGDHIGFLESNLQRIYSEEYCRKNRWMIPLLGRLTKPKSYDSFFIQAKACLSHDAFDDLPKIRAATLVIGGGKDKTLGAEPSEEIAVAIPGAALHMYPQWGHGVYEEAKDFNRVILRFLLESGGENG